MIPGAQLGSRLATRSQTARPRVRDRRVVSIWGRQETQSRRAVPKRNALTTTDTELKLMARAAIIGLSSRPVSGYNTPAASDTPSS